MTEYKQWDNFSVRDIPEPYFSELQAASHGGESECMKIGQIVNEMLEAMEAEHIKVPRMRLYKAAGVACRRSGETVRMYSSIVKHTPAWFWSEHPEMGHHQAKALIPACGDDESTWRSMLAAWNKHCDETGCNPGSVDGMHGWLIGLTGGPPAYRVKYQRLLDIIDALIADPAVPDFIRQLLRRLLTDIEQWASKAKGREEWHVNQ